MKTDTLIIANWKMNIPLNFKSWGKSLVDVAENRDSADIIVCPPATHLSAIRAALPKRIHLGGQDCSPFENGAYTGDISACMLADMGCEYVIIGHSERRRYHKEDDLLIKNKVSAAILAGLIPIICVGENLEDRRAGRAQETVLKQIMTSTPDAAMRFVLAYEPIWAIGTGETPKLAQIEDIHVTIREYLKQVGKTNIRIIYGGSVNPRNVGAILKQQNVDGVLVGGASLNSKTFNLILSNYKQG